MTILSHLARMHVLTVRKVDDGFSFREEGQMLFKTSLTPDQVIQLAMELVQLVEPDVKPEVCPVERERLALMCEAIGKQVRAGVCFNEGWVRRNTRAGQFAARLCAEAVRSGQMPAVIERNRDVTNDVQALPVLSSPLPGGRR